MEDLNEYDFKTERLIFALCTDETITIENLEYENLGYLLSRM